MVYSKLPHVVPLLGELMAKTSGSLYFGVPPEYPTTGIRFAPDFLDFPAIISGNCGYIEINMLIPNWVSVTFTTRDFKQFAQGSPPSILR